MTWTNIAKSLRVAAFIDNVFDVASVRGISTGNQDNFYRMTSFLLYPRYAAIDVRWSFGS